MTAAQSKLDLTGTYTAIVTPFDRSGAVDYARLRDLVEWQIQSGIDGLVPVGTTGESPTLDYAEHEKVIEEVIRTARRRVKIVAGTGGNDWDAIGEWIARSWRAVAPRKLTALLDAADQF